MTAEEVLRWAAEEFGDKLCLTCSWQRQSSVLIHMLSELGLDVDIVELDTLVLFPETYETRDRLVERYGLELTSFRPVDPPQRLHPLVHGVVGRRQDDHRRARAPRARTARAARRVARRRRGARAPLEGPRLLEGGPGHEHRPHRLGRLAAHAARRGGDRLRD